MGWLRRRESLGTTLPTLPLVGGEVCLGLVVVGVGGTGVWGDLGAGWFLVALGEDLGVGWLLVALWEGVVPGIVGTDEPNPFPD